MPAGDGRRNPPNQTRLSYRIGDYRSFLEEMTKALSSWTAPGDGGQERPGAALDTSNSRDFGMALLGSWAAVGDVLTFYQERIANEGYLRTARERFSTVQLVQQIGYDFDPGRSAATYLAFSLASAGNATTRVLIPKGSAVLGTPAADRLPVIFQTEEDVDAAVEWNALTLAPRSSATLNPITPEGTAVRLQGTRTGLRVGNGVLVASVDAANNESAYLFGVILSVTQHFDRGYTTITWSPMRPGGDAPAAESGMRQRVFAFGKRAWLFGKNAPDWNGLPDAMRARFGTVTGGVASSNDGGQSWKPGAKGLPPSDVRDLVFCRGSLFAATAGGLFRLNAVGDQFLPVLPSIARRDVLAITQDAYGNLYAATSGGVFRSSDSGQSWDALRGRRRTTRGVLQTGSVNETFPNTTARAILVCPDTGPGWIFAGTSDGVLRSPANGSAWTAVNKGLPGYDDASGLASVTVLALALHGATQSVFCGTDRGLFRSGDWGGTWAAVPLGTGRVASLLSVPPQAGNAECVLAVIDTEVRISSDGGKTWTVSRGLTGQNIISLAAVPGAPTGSFLMYAGSESGIFISRDSGASFTALPDTKQWVATAFAAAPGGPLFLGMRYGGIKERDDWPGFRLSPGSIDLDQVLTGLAPGSWVALYQGGADPKAAAFKVLSVGIVFRSDFLLNSTVTRIQVDPSPGLAAFSLRDSIAYVLSEEIAPQEDQFPDPRPYLEAELPLTASVTGFGQPRKVAITGQRPTAVLVADLGGIFELRPVQGSAKGKTEWQRIALPRTPVFSIALAASGKIFCLVENDVLAGTGPDLRPLHFPAGQPSVIALQTGGVLIVGAPGGVYTFAENAWKTLGYPEQAVAAIAIGPKNEIYAASVSGAIYELAAAGADWQQLAGTGDVGSVSSLVATADGALYAGSSLGVFQFSGGTWSPAGSLNHPVNILTADAADRIYAGTGTGVFGYDKSNWTVLGDVVTGDVSDDIRALAVSAAGTVFASAPGGPIRAWDGNSWSFTGTGCSNFVTVLAAQGDRVLAAAQDSALASGQAGVEIQPTLIQQFSANLAPVVDRRDIPESLIRELGNVSIALSKDARLEIVEPARWLIFTRDPAELSLWPRFTLIQEGDSLWVYENPRFEVLSAPVQKNGWLEWNLRTRTGTPFRLPAFAGELRWEPAASWCEQVSEVATATPTPGAGNLVLSSAPKNVTDPLTVMVNGNLALATHGEKVVEILGSGDASRGNQQFTLKKLPLSFTPDPGSPTGARSTLRIYVTGGQPAQSLQVLTNSLNQADAVLWQPVENLMDAGPKDRVYVARIDGEGTPNITFGDGIRGSRLPTGVENVVGVYRSGSGADGNFGPNRLTVLRSSPQGVRTVTNPIPASGGVAAEAIDSVRVSAPRSVRTLGRVVSLSDYEDFAGTFPGIGKVQARMVWNGVSRILHLTVASASGEAFGADDRTIADLIATIELHRPFAQPMIVEPWSPVHFSVQAALFLKPGSDRSATEQTLRATLRHSFSFAYRNLAEPVTSAGITLLMQSVAGVEALRVKALYLAGTVPVLNEVIRARPAHWDAKARKIRPAELLQLDEVVIA